MGLRGGNITVVRGLITDGQGRYPFVQRRSDARNNPGQWEAPGGKRRWWESHLGAVNREIREELGLQVDIPNTLVPCAVYRRPLREDPTRLHNTRFYLGRVVRGSDPILRLPPGEIQDANWYSPEEVLERNREGNLELTEATWAALETLSTLVVHKTTILLPPAAVYMPSSAEQSA